MVDNANVGITPTIATLSRYDNHSMKVEKPGHLPYETMVAGSASGWIFGNILLGGLIGLGIDLYSGGAYTLSPEQVSATLIQASTPEPHASPTPSGQPVPLTTASP